MYRRHMILWWTGIILLISNWLYAGIYSGGFGTVEAPFKISTSANWQELIATSSDWDKNFLLMTDLDLQNLLLTPVGNYSTQFTGIFNGNGHVIHNAAVTQPEGDYVGLFGYLGYGGKIHNLRILNTYIAGRNRVGGLCGKNSGAIVNCYVAGSIAASGYVGGLVGENNSTITSSYTTGVASGMGDTIHVGGLVGNNHASITNSYTTAIVQGIGNYIGGLVGTNNGTIASSYTQGTIYGIGDYIGGLVGENSSTIFTCYTTGTVVNIGDYVGGFCGTNTGTISLCFWNMETSGLTVSAGGEGKMNEQMQTLSTFTDVGWDFTNEIGNGTSDFWRMCSNGTDYPRLNWQSIDGDFTCPDGIETQDLNYYVNNWLLNNCTTDNNFCGGTDLNYSGTVDLADWVIFADKWLLGI